MNTICADRLGLGAAAGVKMASLTSMRAVPSGQDPGLEQLGARPGWRSAGRGTARPRSSPSNSAWMTATPLASTGGCTGSSVPGWSGGPRHEVGAGPGSDDGTTGATVDDAVRSSTKLGRDVREASCPTAGRSATQRARSPVTASAAVHRAPGDRARAPSRVLRRAARSRTGRPARRRRGRRPTPGRRAGARARRRGRGRARRPRSRSAGRPTPPRAKRSKMRSRSSAGTPGPWSSTAIHTCRERSSPSAARLDGDRHLAAAVVAGVVDEVGHDAGQAPLVAVDDQVLGRARSTVTGVRRQAAHAHRLAHELGDEEVLAVQADRRRRRSGRSRAGPRRGPGSGRRRPRAGRARPAACSGISSRRACITSTDAASVISGERSSWLTSDANRASRSTRCCERGRPCR